MPRRKEQFEIGSIAHITLRALDDNMIFNDINDYYRGIFSIYEFNDNNYVSIQKRRAARSRFKRTQKEATSQHRELTGLAEQADLRDRLVDILAFCFMPNHIHLLLKQIKENGISKFMQKVGIGLGKYFNIKHKRRGHVFQDTFKSVHIKDNDQFMVVIPYIFTNPTALIEPGWREFGIRNHSVKEVVNFLEDYKWSSYRDCVGFKNFPSVTERDFLLRVMGGEDGCRDAVNNWIGHKKDVGQFADLFLEQNQ